MSLPLRPLNPHQQFSLLRPLSQPYHEVSNDILPKYSNIDPSMSADYQYVPEPSDHVIHLSAMKGANSSQLKTLVSSNVRDIINNISSSGNEIWH